jgi:hypothetical protein
MSALFGDFDPEDALDASDPPAVRLRLLVRWVASVLEEVDDVGPTDRVQARVRGAVRLFDALEVLSWDRDDAALLAIVRHVIADLP